MIKITLLMALLGGMLCGDAVAKERVYKWTDPDGTVHFSDQPLGQQVTPMVISPTPPSKPAGDPRAAEQAPQDADKKPSSDQDAVFVANPDEDPAVRAKNCEQSRQFVKALQESEGRRIYVNNEDGTRHWLSDDERVQKLDAGNKAIKKWCN